jgi:hypothetical protein
MSTMRAKISAKAKQQHKEQRLPTALKHGVFCRMTILPGENPAEFARLHASLIEEWKPSGQTEFDAVFTIAKDMWRKARLQRFQEVRITGCTWDPVNKLFDEPQALRSVYRMLEKHDHDSVGSDAANAHSAPEGGASRTDAAARESQEAPQEAEIDEDIRVSLDCLSKDDAEHLRQNFPRHAFESSSERVAAIRKEIMTVLLPKSVRFGSPPTEVLLDAAAQVLTPEVWEHELAVEERINASIYRATKFLIECKAMKQILAQTPEQMKVITPRPRLHDDRKE